MFQFSKGSLIPEMTRFRHLYSGEKIMSEKEAVLIASKRDPRIKKTTIFEETSEFLSCKIKTKHGFDRILLSKVPLRTFHCIYSNSVWIPFYVGRYYAVFVDGGRNFPGYLTKNVTFCKNLEEFPNNGVIDVGFETTKGESLNMKKDEKNMEQSLESKLKIETIEVNSWDEYFDENNLFTHF